MRRRTSYQQGLTLVLSLGVLIRVCLAFGTKGLVFDLHSFVVVNDALHNHPLHVYALVNTRALDRWPYPPGFFPFTLLTGSLSNLSGMSFTSIIRLPSILADTAIAWLVQDFLRSQGASEQRRLAAACAVALGPLFIAISGFNGQIDSVAILPVIGGVVLWGRIRPGPRAVVVGLLIGVGCAIKSFPLVMVLAFLPSCQSVREGAQLVSAAITVPALSIAPFLIADSHSVIAALKYHSLAGQGGISLLAQPDLARIWLGGPIPHLTNISNTLQGKLGTVIAAGALGFAGLAVLRFRARSVDAAILLWLTLFAFSVNFSPRYAVWAIPFTLMAGRIGASMALQALLIVPTVLLLAAPIGNPDVIYVYVPLMLVTWAAFLLGTIAAGRAASEYLRPALPR